MLRKIREKYAHAAAALDTALTQIAAAGAGWLKWTFLFAIALGAGLFSFAHPAYLPALDINKLSNSQRLEQIFWAAGALGALLLSYAATAFAYRKKLGAFDIQSAAARINRGLYPLLSLPLIAALSRPGIEKQSPRLSLLFCALIGLAFGRACYELPIPSIAQDAPEFETRKNPWFPRIAAALFLTALFVGYGLFFSQLSINNHHALNTHTGDLAYYDNIFYQSIHGRPFHNSFLKSGYPHSAHFEPILILLSPLYFIHPRAELLLILQSFWIGSGIFAIYMLSLQKRNHRFAGILFAIIYAAYPALHGANLFEFHTLTLICPLILWLIYFLERGMCKSYFGILTLLLLCREDLALLLGFVGAYALLSQKPGTASIGRSTLLLSLLYFIAVNVFFKPQPSGLDRLFHSLITNPAFALKLIFEEDKILWFALIFAPLAFLPLAARRARFMLAGGLLCILLASKASIYSIYFHYSALVFTIAFAITPMALQSIRDSAINIFALEGRRLARALLGTAFVTAMMMSWKFGALLPNQNFRTGFEPVAFSLTAEQRARYAWVRAMVEKIPRNAAVSATPRLGPHISNRKYASFYPAQPSDYILADLEELRGPELELHQKKLESADLIEVGRYGQLGLWKRKGL